jgi:serine protease Do
MSMVDKHIHRAKQCIVEIATPYNTGSGFYLKDYNVIITNEHVIRDNQVVIIKGQSFDKQIAQVLLIDEYADIAIISAPLKHSMPAIVLRLDRPVIEGEMVTAMGHPYGLKFSMTKGIVSSIEQQERGLDFIMHDAALNPGNSGGPLIDENGLVLGVNSFVMRDGENLGFTLPASLLAEALEGFDPVTCGTGARCLSCRKFIYDKLNDPRYCNHCGAEVLFPSKIKSYVAVGVPKIIEDIIQDLGYDIRLTREGRNHWNITRGSALVSLSYHKNEGLIDGDAYLCRLPPDNAKEIYTFLMQENFNSEGLVFSIKGQFVLLSLLIYDRHLDEDTGRLLLERLFERADYYDDILIERFGATWIKQL